MSAADSTPRKKAAPPSTPGTVERGRTSPKGPKAGQRKGPPPGAPTPPRRSTGSTIPLTPPVTIGDVAAKVMLHVDWRSTKESGESSEPSTLDLFGDSTRESMAAFDALLRHEPDYFSAFARFGIPDIPSIALALGPAANQPSAQATQAASAASAASLALVSDAFGAVAMAAAQEAEAVNRILNDLESMDSLPGPAELSRQRCVSILRDRSMAWERAFDASSALRNMGLAGSVGSRHSLGSAASVGVLGALNPEEAVKSWRLAWSTEGNIESIESIERILEISTSDVVSSALVAMRAAHAAHSALETPDPQDTTDPVGVAGFVQNVAEELQPDATTDINASVLIDEKGAQVQKSILGLKSPASMISAAAEAATSDVELVDPAVRLAGELLGFKGADLAKLRAPRDAHELIMQGIPHQALTHLVSGSRSMSSSAFSAALGISDRTLRRLRDQGVGEGVDEGVGQGAGKPLSREIGSRAWRFAELLARSITVFGGREEAERWMNSEVMGLDGQKPIELLTTSAGEKLVEDFLGRVEFGVYA